MPLSKTRGACAVGATVAASFLAALPAVRAQGTLTPPNTLLPTAGTKEISVAGNYSFNGDKPYAVQGSYGVFTSPTVEFGGVAAISGASHATTASSAGAFANYYFAGGADNQLLKHDSREIKIAWQFNARPRNEDVGVEGNFGHQALWSLRREIKSHALPIALFALSKCSAAVSFVFSPAFCFKSLAGVA